MRILLLDSKIGAGKEHSSIPVEELSAQEYTSAGLVLQVVKSSREMADVKLDGLDAAIIHIGDDVDSAQSRLVLQLGVPLVVISNAPALAADWAAALRADFPQGRLRDMAAFELSDPLKRCFTDSKIESLFDNPLDLALELLTDLYGVVLRFELDGERITLQRLSSFPGNEGRVLLDTAARLLETHIVPGLVSEEDVFNRFLVDNADQYRTQLANLRDQLLDTVYSNR
jgi:hypothetical protein